MYYDKMILLVYISFPEPFIFSVLIFVCISMLLFFVIL